MPRPQTVTDQQVIESARREFLRHGHTYSIKSLAATLGVTHSAIFQRFGSKRHLLISAMRPPAEIPWPPEADHGPHPDAEVQGLLELCQTMHHFFIEHSPRIRVLQTAGICPQEIFPNGDPPPLLACLKVQRWIERGIERRLFMSCDAQALGVAVVGMVFSSTLFEDVQQMLIRRQSSRQVDTSPSIAPIEASEMSSSIASLELGQFEAIISLFIKGILSSRPPKGLGDSSPSSSPSEIKNHVS
jgi:AcrR family transcriptional regulator